MKIKVNSVYQGVCPYCGECEVVYYDAPEMHADNSVTVNVKCDACGREFVEEYWLSFGGQWVQEEDSHWKFIEEGGSGEIEV